jgi:GNAT superfamily N-acetyltransferase
LPGLRHQEYECAAFITVIPMPLTYRNATKTDLPFIIELVVEDSVIATGDDPADALDAGYVAALEALTSDPNNRLVIADLDGQAVGTLQLTFIPGLMRRGMWRLLVEQVHIASHRRNRGLGGEMIRWAIEQARARNCGMVQLTSNKKRLDAHRFYERLGFLRSHEGFKYYL